MPCMVRGMMSLARSLKGRFEALPARTASCFPFDPISPIGVLATAFSIPTSALLLQLLLLMPLLPAVLVVILKDSNIDSLFPVDVLATAFSTPPSALLLLLLLQLLLLRPLLPAVLVVILKDSKIDSPFSTRGRGSFSITPLSLVGQFDSDRVGMG